MDEKTFLGNQKQKNQMHSFLNSDSENVVILISESGLGKTSFCNFIFSFYQLNVIRPFYESFSSHKELVTFINNIINVADVVNTNQKVILFDDVEVIIMNDRYFLNYLQNLLKSLNKLNINIKIVLTCTTKEEKRLSNIRKKYNVIRLDPPSFEECKRYLLKSNTINKLQLEEQTLDNLINVSNQNIQSIISKIYLYFQDSDIQYIKQNIFDICKTICYNPSLDIKHLNILMSSDPILISYIIYDNIKSFIINNYEPNEELYLSGISYIQNCYIKSCIIESYAYNTCSWNFIEIINLIKCFSIRILQNKLKPKLSNSENNLKKIDMVYTNIATRSSQHYSNLRKFKKLNSLIHFTPENSAMMFETLYLKNKKCFTDEMNTYVNNICDKNISPYSKNIKVLSIHH